MKQEMSKQIAILAFDGVWGKLMPLLRAHPDLVNSASTTKGYTSLHQAAWHGASPAVVGELLALGADRGLKTQSKGQTPQEIATEKHRGREDLGYLLAPGRRTLGQLMRRAAATRGIFGPYDGNQTILDQLVSSLDAVTCPVAAEEVEARIAAAFLAVTGVALSAAREQNAFLHNLGVRSFELAADLSFWRSRFFPALEEGRAKAHLIPIEPEWAAVSDLFDPAPVDWGLRGNLFLWIEMRRALCQAELPGTTEALAQTISTSFASLTGQSLTGTGEFLVKRFSRGGMSSGAVSCEFWMKSIIPTLQLRLGWLRESWAR